MTVELRGRTASDLTRLGGLRERCSAALVCSEHSVSYPCGACEALNLRSVACAACLKEFSDRVPETGERVCFSVAMYEDTGRIAFEADALAAEKKLPEGERERRIRRAEVPDKDPSKEVRSDSDGTGPAVDRPDAETRGDRPAELSVLATLAERERRIRGPEPPEKDRTGPAADRPDAETRGDRLAQLCALASLAAAIAGAGLLWQKPPLALPSTSGMVLSAYMLTLFLVWAAGAITLSGKQAAHGTLRGWAPLAWAGVHFTWPGVVGLGVAYVIGSADLGSVQYFKLLAVVAFTALLGFVSVSHCCVALTMRPPWPKGLLAENFAGLRSKAVWIALVATLLVNILVWNRQGALLWTPQSNAPDLKLLLKAVEKKPAIEKDPSGFGKAILADIVEAVYKHPNIADAGSLPEVDAAVAAMGRLPRPPRGDHAAAHKLNAEAEQLMIRSANWGKVAEVLGRAHVADPPDIQILNELAYAQMRAGLHAQALENILETLRLAPTRANAWAALAQLRLWTAHGDTSTVHEAARYYLVAYWFSRDRARTLRLMKAKLTAGPEDPDGNRDAVQIVLHRLGGGAIAQERICPDGKRAYFGVCPDDANSSRPTHGPGKTKQQYQTSFNCSATILPADLAVCEDERLAALDIENTELFKKALNANEVLARDFVKTNYAKKINCGGNKICLEGVYSESIGAYLGIIGSNMSVKQK